MGRREDLSKLGLHTVFATISPQWIVADRRHYQRPLDEDRVRELLKRSEEELNERKPLVGLRSDELYYVLDGQHHVAAAQRKGMELIEVLCFPSTGWHHEQLMFSRFQHAQRDGSGV